MDESDERALFEYGGLAAAFVALATTPLVGDLEAPVTGSRAAAAPRWARQSAPCFAGVEGDSAAELALLEFASLACLTAHLPALAPDAAASSLGAWPESDADLTALGERWGRAWAAKQRALHDDDAEEEDAAAAAAGYGTFDAVLGRLALAVWHKTFGASLGDVSAAANRHGKRASGERSADGRMKRKPSGAELSAYIGQATQAALGLADPSRKVRTRAVF